jgi:hypothetical protein
MSTRGLSLVTIGATLLAPALAAAGDNDLVMSRLARVV